VGVAAIEGPIDPPSQSDQQRRLRIGWVADIEVNAADIRRLFANEPSIVALEQLQALADEESPAKHCGGRPPAFDWELLHNEMIRLMKLNGNFSPDKQHWKTPAQLVERLCNSAQTTPLKSRPQIICERKYGHGWLS
jgi:hypothetical protein